MMKTSLDLTDKHALEFLATLITDIRDAALGADPLLVGALARL